MQDNIIKIDFTQFDGPLYAGRERGLNAAKKINLETLVNDETKNFIIIIPDNFYSITSSFFLGMFGKSIKFCKTKENFLNRFNFNNFPDDIKTRLNDWIDRALISNNTSYFSDKV